MAGKKKKKNHLKLVPPLAEWQRWPRGYEPTEEELAKLSEEEWIEYMKNEFRRSQENHPAGWNCTQ